MKRKNSRRCLLRVNHHLESNDQTCVLGIVLLWYPFSRTSDDGKRDSGQKCTPKEASPQREETTKQAKSSEQEVDTKKENAREVVTSSSEQHPDRGDDSRGQESLELRTREKY